MSFPPGSAGQTAGCARDFEDQLGAGAVIHYLPGTRSPEAQAAEAVFLHYQENLLEVLLACSSGKEAVDRGSWRDLDLAAELNVSDAAPFLVEGAYRLG